MRWASASTVVTSLHYNVRSLTSVLAYFVQLGLSHEEASELHHRYYKTYGLALRGLVMHHDVGEPIP